MRKIHASAIIHRDQPCRSLQPRAHQDASARYKKHGPIRPMEEPGFFKRLFGKRA